jgi:hypothetical protein
MYNILNVSRNVPQMYNIPNVCRNVNNKTLLSLDVLAVTIKEVGSIADMILGVRTIAKARKKSPNNEIRCSISISTTKDYKHPF